MTRVFIIFFVLIFNQNLFGQKSHIAEIDVLHYNAEIEPDITKKTIRGHATISFNVIRTGTIMLDRGDLVVESVQIKNKKIPFELKAGKLSFEVAQITTNQTYVIDVHYYGAPTRGIVFYPELEQVYTVFSTSQWLVCKDQPDDKATHELKITIPSHLKGVASGQLQKSAANGNTTVMEWGESKPFPTYIYGFAVGRFNEFTDSTGNVKLRYLSSAYSTSELKKVFTETKSMIQFFEERSDVSYPGQSYTQVLGEGNVSQEMACFTVMRLSYGKQVLADSSNINLAAHELAHQWWGNSVTCANWNHFWLNEGFAVFMASAFKEYRYGRVHYLKDIDTYRDAYETVVKKGVDKPLTFKDWLNPTSDDRTLVYYKGAYVLHLLREQLGEEAFWQGIKEYTSAHFGKNVTAADLRKVLEKASGKDLAPFFSKWIAHSEE